MADEVDQESKKITSEEYEQLDSEARRNYCAILDFDEVVRFIDLSDEK